MKKLIREPLIHFLLIGGVLFGIYSIKNPQMQLDSDRRIVVTPGRIEQLANIFVKTWQRPPTPEELKGLIDDFVLEEAYYRTAIAMGIDKNDTMIRRRLRQKMEFLTEDATALTEPSDEVLAAYLAEHKDQFRTEPIYTFRQIYFNPEKYGKDAVAFAHKKAIEVRNGTDLPGDQTLLPETLSNASRRTVDGTFGTGFAEKLDILPLGKWSEPIHSGMGIHLIKLESHQPGRLPSLEEIRPLVKREWANDKRIELRKKFNEALLKNHEVVIEWPKAETKTDSGE
jgi:hypothetical protein